MAYNYQNYEKFYNAMNDSQRAKWNEQNKNDADFNDFLSKYNAKNQTTTPVSTPKTNTGTNTGTSNTRYKDSDWYYSATERNTATWWAEFWPSSTSGTTSGTTNNSNATKANTTPASTTNNTNATPAWKSDTISAMKEYWEWLDYDQQQEKIKASPWLKEWLAKYGIVSKTKPTDTTQTETTPTTPSKWDYSDNSPERMGEIADNLERYYLTNPWLFTDENAFRNFFIDWKWRTPEQEAFLMDYFKNRQLYNEYDWYTAEKVWYMQAHWQVPQSYLNYLKNSNPDRYNSVMDYKDQTEKGIEAESYYDTLLSESWFWTKDTNAIKFMKENWLLVDKNSDRTDDWLYPEPSEEEKQLNNEDNEYEAEKLKLKNAMKDLQSDLIDQYPDADLSTIMILTSDRWTKIQKALDSISVAQTKTQWRIEYLQNERKLQADARQNTINNIAKNYWMYYSYTPEWMSELAQAQYAATNVTLDQADNWTDTQKQMALDSVLTDYFDKYGSIIQRSKSQVINDVMKLAKDKWITLSQALQENFITPLKNKDEFEILSTGRTISNSSADKWAKLTDDKLFNTATWEIIDANWNVVGNTWWVWSTSQTWAWKSYTVVSSTQLVSWLSDFLDWYNVGDKWWQCWAFVNKWLKAIWVADSNLYDNSLDSKLKSKNEEADATAQTGWVAIYDPSKLTWAWAEHWHVGWVVKDNGDGTVAIIDSNWTKNAEWKYDETVWYHPRVSKSSLYWYFNPTKSNWSTEDADLYNAKVLSWIPTQLRNTDVEKQWYIDIAKWLREKWLSSFEAAMAIMWFDIKNDSPEAQATKEKILNTTMAQWDEIIFNSSTLASMAESINAWNYEWALKTLENQLWKYVAKQLWNDLSRDNMSEAMQAISDFDRINTNWTQWTWNRLSSYLWAEWWKTIQFNSDLANLSATMRKLWYSEDEIENLLPKQSYNKTEFKKSIDTLQKNILNKYNMIRQNHWMPAESRASLLWNIPLSSVYWLNAEMEAMDII